MIDGKESAYPFSGAAVDLNGKPISYCSYGLTKREAFLMAAMQGFCANAALVGDCSCVDIWKICDNAKRVAEQMLSNS